MIEILSEYYEINIFTASSPSYAIQVVSYLDPDFKYIKNVLHKFHCLKTKSGISIKDLRIIKNRDLKNMLIVDNSLVSFYFQLSNGIPILEFFLIFFK